VPALRQLRASSGSARLGLTWTEGEEPPLALMNELGIEYWNPMHGLVTPAGVVAVHAAGRRVSTWTVDSVDDIQRLVETGVDAIVSNEVATLVQCLSDLGQ